MSNKYFIALAGCALVASLASAQQQRETVQAPTSGLEDAIGTPPTLPPSPPVDKSKLDQTTLDRLKMFEEAALPPGATFSDFLEKWLKPRPYPKDVVIMVDEKTAYPHVAVPWKMEITKIEGDIVWMRGLAPEDPESPIHEMWVQLQVSEILTQERREVAKTEYFLDFEAELIPPPSRDELKFEAVEGLLPEEGRWQMSFAFGDMNEDGLDDLIAPPMRKGYGLPSIYLNRGGGTFELWREPKWTGKVPWDYGAIEVADFDGDGHLDLAIAIHFKTQHIVYGDGAGMFARSEKLPSVDPRITSRAVTAADFDLDGDIDLAFQAELDLDRNSQTQIPRPTVWIVSNTAEGWVLDTAGMPSKIIGDTILSGDIDGDSRPDLLYSSNAANQRQLVRLNSRDGWKSIEEQGVLSNSYHYDLALPIKGDVGGDRGVFAVFQQYLRRNDVNRSRTGVVSYGWATNGVGSKGLPIVVVDDRNDPYFRIASGDLNGDKRTDLLVSRKSGVMEVYIGTRNGFELERSPELEKQARPFDLQLRDLDGDGRDDIIAMFADIEGRSGGIRIWLTRS